MNNRKQKLTSVDDDFVMARIMMMVMVVMMVMAKMVSEEIVVAFAQMTIEKVEQALITLIVMS